MKHLSSLFLNVTDYYTNEKYLLDGDDVVGAWVDTIGVTVVCTRYEGNKCVSETIEHVRSEIKRLTEW